MPRPSGSSGAAHLSVLASGSGTTLTCAASTWALSAFYTTHEHLDPRAVIGDDVSSVCHLGRMVCHHGPVSGRHTEFLGKPDRAGLQFHRPGGNDLTVLRGDGGGPVFCHRTHPGGAAPGGWGVDVSVGAGHDLRDLLPTVDRAHPLLHAHAGAHELHFLSSHAGSRQGVPSHPGLGNHQLDRHRMGGGPVFPAGRHDSAAFSNRRRGLDLDGALLPHPAAHAADTDRQTRHDP